MAIEDVLANVELFSELPRKDLSRLAKVTVVRDFKEGQVIVREGELGIAFYVVAQGRVEVVKGLDSAHEQVIATMRPNSFFGEMALFDNQVRSASVRAAEDRSASSLPSGISTRSSWALGVASPSRCWLSWPGASAP